MKIIFRNLVDVIAERRQLFARRSDDHSGVGKGRRHLGGDDRGGLVKGDSCFGNLIEGYAELRNTWCENSSPEESLPHLQHGNPSKRSFRAYGLGLIGLGV